MKGEGNKDLGDRLRAYVLKSGKTIPDLCGEMKFQGPQKTETVIHSWTGKKVRRKVLQGKQSLQDWLIRGSNPRSPESQAVVEDYLRRMKA